MRARIFICLRKAAGRAGEREGDEQSHQAEDCPRYRAVTLARLDDFVQKSGAPNHFFAFRRLRVLVQTPQPDELRESLNICLSEYRVV